MSKTKIVVLQMKEIIYTAIFACLGILLILLLIFMFLPGKKEKASDQESMYRAGVYTTQLTLNEATMNLQVVLDPDQIRSIELVHLDDSVATMYPLVQPALEDIAGQLISGKSIENIVLSDQSRFTQTMLLESIEEILKQAGTQPNL